MDDTPDETGDASPEVLEGFWYADSFRVGHNAFEFKVDCGHEDSGHEGPDNEVSTVYFRLITNPFNAQELFKLLGAGLLRYTDTFGAIDENGSPDPKPGARS